MNQPAVSPAPGRSNASILRIGLFVLLALVIIFFAYKLISSGGSGKGDLAGVPEVKEEAKDTVLSDSARIAIYDSLMKHLANGDTTGRWPVKTDYYPLPGSLLPYKRIVSFYGNFYSKQMGILGELPPAAMLAKLQAECKKWQEADSTQEVIPALHYIAVTAQSYPGKGGKHRLRMPFHQIDSAINMAARINAIVFLDVQVGLSTVQEEIPELEKYLLMPQVHLGIDPEFSMKGGQAPGKVIGSFDAADINYVADYLTKLVKANNLPPKVLIVHRFTRNMVTNYKQIKLRPEVQFVMDMDGWGGVSLKKSSYLQYIYREPVQYTGFKLFYKNDIKNNNRMMTPDEVLALRPRPVYIQYQ